MTLQCGILGFRKGHWLSGYLCSFLTFFFEKIIYIIPFLPGMIWHMCDRALTFKTVYAICRLRVFLIFIFLYFSHQGSLFFICFIYLFCFSFYFLFSTFMLHFDCRLQQFWSILFLKISWFNAFIAIYQFLNQFHLFWFQYCFLCILLLFLLILILIWKSSLFLLILIIRCNQ